MKYSFMSFSSVQSNLFELISLAKKYGYDAIELRVGRKDSSGHGHGHAHGVSLDMSENEINDIKVLLDEEKMPVSCIATSCMLLEEANIKRHIVDAKKAIDLAYKLNSPVIRVFGGWYEEGKTREEAIVLFAKILSELADYAKEKSVIICVETHDVWCDPTHVANVMKKVNSPYVGVTWDILHPLRHDIELEDTYKKLRKWVKHVHIHDAVFKLHEEDFAFVPIGTGLIDHKKLLSLLIKGGYDGYLSGEWIGFEPADVHLPREIETMKKYEKQF